MVNVILNYRHIKINFTQQIKKKQVHAKKKLFWLHDMGILFHNAFQNHAA
jgi:hypothetical protein